MIPAFLYLFPRKIEVSSFSKDHKLIDRVRRPFSGLVSIKESLTTLLHLLEKCFICFNVSPLKMMKNAFYFILKVLFIL